MNFAIIAAGEGSRLAAEGINIPKPLVPINGTPLIERLMDIFIRHGATSISVIVNSENHQTIRFLQNKQIGIPLHLVIKSTPGSMHSFHALKPYLKDADFCLTTVDTVFIENEFTTYLSAFRNRDSNIIGGMMAVTDFIDDEKPLYVGTRNDLTITDFYDKRQENNQYISGGIYCLSPAVLDILETGMQNGITRMRDFQRSLIRHGITLKAFPFSKIIDIDHASDIEKAETLISSSKL